MLSIQIDAAEVIERFIGIGARFDNFPPQMREELVVWQLDDMNRSRPEAEMPDSRSVVTTVRSRSNRIRRRIQRRPRAGRPRAIGRSPRARLQRRAILRVELMEALVDRMRDLAGRNLTWR